MRIFAGVLRHEPHEHQELGGPRFDPAPAGDEAMCDDRLGDDIGPPASAD